jgi:hypothetical protein
MIVKVNNEGIQVRMLGGAPSNLLLFIILLLYYTILLLLIYIHRTGLDIVEVN